ncbi:hypothetical protein, partial [Cellulomonas citrea]|uniref:hypothetical protein n=1 Tax=Cellulomonas citrea TaxID=1909423 RepID=UPI00135AC180
MSSVTRRLVATFATALVVLSAVVAPASAQPRTDALASDGSAPSDGSTPGGDPSPSLATFGIAPASPAGPDGRSYVVIGAAPGSVVTDDVAILNQSDFAVPLDVYASEATNAPDGTLALANRDGLTDAGTWVSLGASHVQVPAQSSAGIGYVVVPVTVRIPTDAVPGDHVAAVIASLTTSGSGGDNAPNLTFEQRVGARIYVTVTGDVVPGLAITGVHTSYDRGPWWGLLGRGRTTVSYTVENTGDMRVAVAVRARTAGPFGLLPRTAAGEPVAELLPRAKVPQTIVVDDVWPLLRSRVTLTGTAGVAPGGKATGLAPVVVATHLWTVPWAWLAGLVLLLVLVLVLLLVRRRRGRRSSGAAGRGGR